MSGGVLLLADELGPRGRRRVRIASAVALVVVAAVLAVAVQRLGDRGQLDWDKWEPFTRWSVVKFLWEGLANTLRATGAAMVLALVLGTVLALMRLSQTAPVRWVAAVFIEFFRGIPLILLIFFSYTGLRTYDVDITPFRALVLALAVYNGAILGDIFRAGIRSLDRGQSEAAYSLGLSYWQTMLRVVIPQAVRRMVPATVSQLVTLLKDSSLGFVVTYQELLRRGRISGDFFGNPLQALVVVAVVYIVVNLLLGRLARWLEIRQRRRLGAGAMVVTGLEDMGALAAAGTARIESSTGS